MTSTWLIGGVSIGAYLAWATALLLAGLMLSYLLGKRPAREHCALLLSMFLCLALLPLGLAAHRAGLGLLGPAADTVTAAAAAPSSTPSASVESEAEPAPVENEPSAPATPKAAPAAPTAPKSGPKLPSVPVGTVLTVAWAAFSALAMLRFITSLFAGRRLLRNARPAHDPDLQGAVDAAVAALGMRCSPAVYVSDAVRSPVIWSWRLHPALLVPASFIDRVGSENWRGVLCHELAHVTRRDHWAALVSELLMCLLPWHPLVWASKRRLAHLSELACDDWAVACGQDGPRYAESLVDLAPQRRPILAPSAATSRNGLKRRIQRILAGHPGNPRTGLAWASGLVLSFCLLGVLAALTQSCAPEPEPEPEPEPKATYYYYGVSADKQDDEKQTTEPLAEGEKTDSQDEEEKKERDDLVRQAEMAAADLRGESISGTSSRKVRPGTRTSAGNALRRLPHLPPEVALKVLRENWDQIAEQETKTRIPTAFSVQRNGAKPYKTFTFHPALLEVLHLCVTDSSHEVRFQAYRRVNALAFRNLAGDPQGYQAWYEKNHDRPIEQVLLESSADFAERLRAADAFGREELMSIIEDAASDTVAPVLKDMPELGRRLVDDGILDAYAEMIRQEDLPEHMLRQIFTSLAVITPTDDFVERVVYPLYKDEAAGKLTKELAYDLLRSLGPWHARLLMENLTAMLSSPRDTWRTPLPNITVQLAALGDYRAVPQLVAYMQSHPDDERDSVPQLGQALQNLTQVPLDPSHDAAWWRQWWEKNRQRFDPEIAAIDIPEPAVE